MDSYEKKYKKALDVAKRKLCFDKVGMVDSFTPNDIYEMFPELKESSDERIRQELIAIYSVGAKANMKTGDILDKDIVTWLEKQGEHANFRNKIRIGDKVTRNKYGELVNLSQLKRVAKPTEEYNITGIGSKNAQGKLGEMIKRKLKR